MAKLTKAQRRFMEQSQARGFTRDCLGGPERLMAERLCEQGLMAYRHRVLGSWDRSYELTDAGRAALKGSSRVDQEEV